MQRSTQRGGEEGNVMLRRSLCIPAVVTALVAPTPGFAQAVGNVTTAPAQVAPALAIPGLVLLVVMLTAGAMYLLRRPSSRVITVFLLATVGFALVAYANGAAVVVDGGECTATTTQTWDPLSANPTLLSQCPNLIYIVALDFSCGPRDGIDEAVVGDLCTVGLTLAPGQSCLLPVCTT